MHGSLASSSSPSAPPASLPHTATTKSGLTVRYRVEHCDWRYRVVGTLSTTRSGYFWVNYSGLVNGEFGQPPVYKSIPPFSAFLAPGYTTDELSLGGAGTVAGPDGSILRFGFDPYGPGASLICPTMSVRFRSRLITRRCSVVRKG